MHGVRDDTVAMTPASWGTEVRRRRTRVGAFARVARCALPAFSVSPPTQDHCASITGPEVLQVDADSTCATLRATGDEPHWLPALGAHAHDSVDTRNPLVGADRDRRELGRQQRTELRLSRCAQLHACYLGRRDHLEPVLHAAGVARRDRPPRALAAPGLLGLLGW